MNNFDPEQEIINKQMVIYITNEHNFNYYFNAFNIFDNFWNYRKILANIILKYDQINLIMPINNIIDMTSEKKYKIFKFVYGSQLIKNVRYSTIIYTSIMWPESNLLKFYYKQRSIDSNYKKYVPHITPNEKYQIYILIKYIMRDRLYRRIQMISIMFNNYIDISYILPFHKIIKCCAKYRINVQTFGINFECLYSYYVRGVMIRYNNWAMVDMIDEKLGLKETPSTL